MNQNAGILYSLTVVPSVTSFDSKTFTLRHLVQPEVNWRDTSSLKGTAMSG